MVVVLSHVFIVVLLVWISLWVIDFLLSFALLILILRKYSLTDIMVKGPDRLNLIAQENYPFLHRLMDEIHKLIFLKYFTK